MARNRKPRPNRQRVRTKPTVAEAPPPPVKVAVVTSPQFDDGQASLRGDVKLVKAALLYADEVEVLGLTASMIHSIGLAPGSSSMSLERLLGLVDITKGTSLVTPQIRALIPAIEALSASGKPLPPELQEGAEMVAEFKAHANELLGPAQAGILEMTGAEEFRPALESGIVTVADLGVGMEHAVAAAVSGAVNSDRESQHWVDEIKSRLADRRTRLLFDEGAGDIMNELLDEGVISPDQIGLRLAGKAALGAGFVARLPAFTEAPMDELLDLRADLDKPLRRYRGAVSQFSVDLPRVIGRELEHEVDHLWETNVSPSLLEINELFHEHSFIKELARSSMLDVGKYLAYAGGVYVGLGAATDLGQAVASVVSAVPGLAEASTRALVARGSAVKAAQQKELFYLHAVNVRLSS